MLPALSLSELLIDATHTYRHGKAPDTAFGIRSQCVYGKIQCYSARQRNRNVTIWPRVKSSAVLKLQPQSLSKCSNNTETLDSKCSNFACVM